jgi:branched-chain amino acid aminotransferase
MRELGNRDKMPPAKKIWMNGKFVDWNDAKIHVLTHAFNYGTAIFEGMRCYDTARGPAVFRLRDHLHRMKDGIKAYEFGYEFSLDTMSSNIKKLIRINKLKSCYIRPICYVASVSIGIDTIGAPYGFAVTAIPFGKYYGKKSENGITCMVSSWRRIKATILSPHVKASANYMNSVLAKKEAMEEGFDEAIMLSDEGHVSEGTGENIFIVKDGEIHTPPLHDAVLAGITRDSLIKVAKDMGIPVSEQSMLRDELYTADEVFLSGTAAEVTAVTQVDHRKITKGAGPITRKLKDAFFNIVNGKDERYSGWLEYIDK